MTKTTYGRGRGTKTSNPINILEKRTSMSNTCSVRTAVPADGLATPRAAVGPGTGEICPFCGQRTARYEHSSSAGVRAASLCCDIPQEFLDNYDVYAGLPEPLRQLAIDRKKAEYDAMAEVDRENARRFRESLDRWHAKYAHLMKGE